eukprot:TRINITY_DN18743_c0_g1_i1.p1 TRINITY_DN18743_c0_g1~~TRINITY_DN18743_c0_g1_i1.p1  ORF type:complete len:187 (+),score=60.51 TRINITY_DN18743_c0_g1_i1:172-732(+)
MEAKTEEMSGLLYEGILMELEMWDVLITALSQRWGRAAGKGLSPETDVNPEMVFTGTEDEIRDKMAIYLVNTTMNYEVDKEVLRGDIAEIMEINFDLTLEDGSDLALATSIMKLYEELVAGSNEYFNNISAKYDKFLQIAHALPKPSIKSSTEEEDESWSSEEEKKPEGKEEEDESEDDDGFSIAK